MYGVLLDVSGSMQSAYALDKSHRTDVECTHAMFTSIVNIVKREVTRREQKESIFVSAFGTNIGGAVTCDFLSLLDTYSNNSGGKAERIDLDEENNLEGKAELIDLAKTHGVSHAERWIKNDLTEFEAKMLYKALQSKRDLIPELIELIPSSITMGAARGAGFIAHGVDSVASSAANLIGFGDVSLMSRNFGEEKIIHDSEAYKFAKKIIHEQDIEQSKARRREAFVQSLKEAVQQLKPRPVKEASEMLDKLLQSNKSLSSSAPSEKSLHHHISELIEFIRPYIFGDTAMCRALADAERIFNENKSNDNSNNVLFILSDGECDGNPRQIAKRLREELGVTIVTCFLTAENIDNPRHLYDSKWTFPKQDGKQVLLEMSSTMKNTHTPVTYLVDANFELPPSGESRLFFQANSLDVVNKFCRIVVSQMEQSSDALVHLLEKVPLATYINQENEKFKPKIQHGGTCYANAIAAVFHLAMHRIVGRDGGYPDFYTIRQCIIFEYGKDGANIKEVLDNVCRRYRLKFDQVNETGARQAINQRRPVVATFWLHADQWEKFSKFYENTPAGILTKSDVAGSTGEIGRHAVVLIRCDPDCLTFLNSWGTKFANGGFFQVKDENVLNSTTFYDVYWTLNDLKPCEKEAYERKCAERAKELMVTFPSIQDLSYECPECNKNSKVNEFLGDILEAQCPKCAKRFKPQNKKILQSLYMRNFN